MAAAASSPPTAAARPAYGTWVTTWLGAPRWDRYLAAGGGDQDYALALYEWNAAVSAAVLHDLAHLEVALRNAYDRALSGSASWADWTANANSTFPPLWRTKRVFDPAQGRKVPTQRDINKQLREQLDRARRDAGGQNATHGKVVAQLMFGFWRYLSSTAHDAGLWRSDLHRAFPPGTARPYVDTRVEDLYRLRNRVAHHEPVFDWDIERSHQHLLDVVGLIAVEIREHVAATSKVPGLVANRPAPAPPNLSSVSE